MASSKEYISYVLDQLSDIEDIAHLYMMGEYVIYYKGKVIGGVFDDRFLVKNTPSAQALMPETSLEIPYPKGKPMLAVDRIDNRDFLKTLLQALYFDLPEPKTKK